MLGPHLILASWHLENEVSQRSGETVDLCRFSRLSRSDLEELHRVSTSGQVGTICSTPYLPHVGNPKEVLQMATLLFQEGPERLRLGAM